MIFRTVCFLGGRGWFNVVSLLYFLVVSFLDGGLAGCFLLPKLLSLGL